MLQFMIRAPGVASRKFVVTLISAFLLSVLSGCWVDFRSLESVAKSSPDKVVVLQVSFQRIQRGPAIVGMLTDSGLSLEQVRFKNVGSGGGQSGVGDPYGLTQPVVDTPQKVEAALARIEAFRANHYESLARVTGTYKEMECPSDDFTAPVKDEHGIPGDYSMELSCGLRIVAIQVRGPAREALSFTQSIKDVADFKKMPMNGENF